MTRRCAAASMTSSINRQAVHRKALEKTQTDQAAAAKVDRDRLHEDVTKLGRAYRFDEWHCIGRHQKSWEKNSTSRTRA